MGSSRRLHPTIALYSAECRPDAVITYLTRHTDGVLATAALVRPIGQEKMRE
jgi:hypothetical protein